MSKPKGAFIKRLVEFTRTYVWEDEDKFREDTKYNSLDFFQKEMVDSYIAGRCGKRVTTQEELPFE